MQVSNSAEAADKDGSTEFEKAEDTKSSGTALFDIDGGSSVLDVSSKSLEFSLSENSENAIEELYLYKNVFNLIPRSPGGLGRLKKLQFFSNAIDLFPAEELGNLEELELLQLKISLPGLSELPLGKLTALKELELFKVPPRLSAFPILSEIAGLKCLTKLSVCHFSIRYLPPEIGCLNSLESLDLSFNKLKSLPSEISYLNALKSLRVSNNKLVEVPSSLSSLQSLEDLDLSNNRLTSLGSLKIDTMHKLHNLNLQYNKLLSCCQIPSWICCNLEGNGKDASNDDFISSSVEMDVLETASVENDASLSCKGSPNTPSSLLIGSSSSSSISAASRLCKRWKRLRQERLRKSKGEDNVELMTMKAVGKRKTSRSAVLASDSLAKGSSDIAGLDDDDKESHSGEAEQEYLLSTVEEDGITSKKGFYVENCSDVAVDSVTISNDDGNGCCDHDASLPSLTSGSGEKEEGSSSELPKCCSKSKRHFDKDLDNPKPCKARRPTDDHSNLSYKYSSISFCSIEDRLPDGFYDAGRERPFMPLGSYEKLLHFDSREVILVDRERDEKLDAIVLSAQAMVFRLKKSMQKTNDREQITVDHLQIASLLALFVSDHFGGSDRTAIIERTRKAVSGSNYRKPFVCTCSTGNSDNINTSTKQILDSTEDIVFIDLSERSLHSIKARRNSIVVPIGTLQFGVCRHRALLFKYLCDRMEPPVPCELVRGYLDFMPHAWNIILIKRDDLWIRMVVDACRPHDIREETDAEYFCRYIPLCRINDSPSTQRNTGLSSSFPSLSTNDEIEKAASSSLIRCKFGSIEAVAKVRTLEACGTSVDKIRNFEYNCLGEVRILGALKHSCIVEFYGHQILSKWDDNLEHRRLQSAILMEHIKGGSLKRYVDQLSKAGEKRVSVDLSLCIARDVASALAELHSKHIIHRDIKSENILIDLDMKRADGTPVVKLCDFDRAVPLRSCLHTCCIAHTGIPPPDTCVGTPRWMAPEVLRAMHKHNIYGLEVDIWSYGCLLLELLTLQIPYSGLSLTNIHELLQMGERPRLTDELEELGSVDEPAMTQSGTEVDAPEESEIETLRFLVDLFRRCTERNPTDRPTAKELHRMLVARMSSCSG